jgi:hypothetical protein
MGTPGIGMMQSLVIPSARLGARNLLFLEVEKKADSSLRSE